ncbi:MAG: nucleoside 2-deoxyribosyltransferase [Bacillaceae bacterium]
MKRIYLASPFFNERELNFVEQVEGILEGKGLNVWSPRKNQLDRYEVETPAWSLDIFRNDVKFIDWAECVVAIYDGNYMDSGTAWEMGYAYGTNKPVIVIHVGENSNLMVHEGAHANLTIEELKDYDFNMLPSKRYEGKMF